MDYALKNKAFESAFTLARKYRDDTAEFFFISVANEQDEETFFKKELEDSSYGHLNAPKDKDDINKAVDAVSTDDEKDSSGRKVLTISNMCKVLMEEDPRIKELIDKYRGKT